MSGDISNVPSLILPVLPADLIAFNAASLRRILIIRNFSYIDIPSLYNGSVVIFSNVIVDSILDNCVAKFVFVLDDKEEEERRRAEEQAERRRAEEQEERRRAEEEERERQGSAASEARPEAKRRGAGRVGRE